MRKIVVTIIILASIAVVAFAAGQKEGGDVVLPAKISKEDMAGSIFSRDDMVEMERYGTNTLDVVTLMSSDKKFASGVYKAGSIGPFSRPQNPMELMNSFICWKET